MTTKKQAWFWRILPIAVSATVALVSAWGMIQRHEVRISRNEQEIEDLQQLKESIYQLNTSIKVQNALFEVVRMRVDKCCDSN